MTKKEQRKQAAAARRAMTAEERQTADAAICARLIALPALTEAGTVFSYMAMGDEVDLSALHAWLQGRGTRLVFPVSLPGGVMEAWEPRGWRSGAFGIREPDREDSRPAAPEEIDLVLAPCVAFDEEGRRLGHGAGYYDRYLPKCPQAPVYAVAYETQKLPRVVCDQYDRIMDLVVTEKGIYEKSL